MEQVNRDLILCLRAALLGETIDCNIASCVSLAQQHGVVHLLYYASARCVAQERPNEELLAALKQKAYAMLLRETAQQRVLDELYQRFESAQIRCTAVKGIVLKAFYPKPELRYMSDMDVLIEAEKAGHVRQIFEEMGCRVLNYDQGETDLYITPQGLIVEVKRSLRSEGFNKETKAFLDKLLSYAVPIGGHRCVCELPNEEHYAYVLCHMVKHLIDGGVGVRPVMDLWFCKNSMVLDKEKLSALLEELKLTDFAKTAEHLACVWFGDEEAALLDTELGDYILSSGSFGSEEHKVADRMLQNKNQKSRFGYIIARFFLPYSTMCRHFPVLRKWPILLPVFWFWRAIRAIFYRRGKLSEELGAVGEANTEKLAQRLDFYTCCGIDISEK